MSETAEPEKPNEFDCCGNGCSPCVFDIYEQQMKLWRNDQLAASPIHQRKDLLSKTRFKSFRLIDKCQNVEDVFTFKFQPVINGKSDVNLISGILPYDVGDHLILRCIVRKDEKKTHQDEKLELESKNVDILTRAYTPITIASQENNCVFQIFAKLYDNGKASRYLRKSLVGDIFYFRGPYGQFKYKPNSYSHILMICMGSGLAPMIPIARSVLANETDETVLHLMYGVKNVNHIIFRKDLKDMTQFWNFTLEYYFSENIEVNCNLQFGERCKHKHVDRTAICEYILDKKMTNLLLLFCGTESFVNKLSQIMVDVKFNCNHSVFCF